MSNSVEIINTLVGVFFVIMSLFGIIKRKRQIFLLGICLFSVLPVIGELTAYFNDGMIGHITTVMAFLSLVIITIPNKIKYGAENLAAVSIAKKIGLAVLVVNLFQAYIILGLENGVPIQYGYLHIALSLVMLYAIMQTISKKDFNWE